MGNSRTTNSPYLDYVKSLNKIHSLLTIIKNKIGTSHISQCNTVTVDITAVTYIGPQIIKICRYSYKCM